MINIRDLSMRCGACRNFLTLASYEPRGEWNAYTFQCDTSGCDPEKVVAILEVPTALDEFAQKHPGCGGGSGSG